MTHNIAYRNLYRVPHRHIIYAVFATMLLLHACGDQQQSTFRFAEDVIPVTVMPLAQHDTTASFWASGLFTTDDETALSFKNGGVIQRVHVKEGDAVKKGQLLATLEPTEINTAVRQAQLAHEKTERDYNRAAKLYADSVATLEQMQNAKTALEAAQQDLERATFNQGHSEIRAPSAGYVLQRLANDGQVVGPGTPVLLVNGAGRDGWLLKVGVGDRQWAAIQVGDGATVWSNASPGMQLDAVVFRKAEGIDPQSGTFAIQLKITTKDLPPLASGMFAKAEIRPSRKAGAWHIPYEALLDGDAGTGYVFVTNDGQTAQQVRVQIADIQKDVVVVVGGLEEAESLIVSGSPYLRDGAKITMNNK